MIHVFQRSWRITKLSFGVINQDREMLLFPLLAGIFSLLFAGALLFPTLVVDAYEGQAEQALGAAEYVLLAITYFVLAFIATFFNVCVVYTAKTRFEGGDATFMESLRFAMSRIQLIAAWSVVAATVGLLLRAIEGLAEQAGGPLKIIASILHSLLAIAWSVTTLFVVPAMVFHELGPIDAIKRSMETLKKTWGESLVRHFGLGVMQFVFMLLVIPLGYVLFMALGGLGTSGTVAALAICAAYVLLVGLVFSAANRVFNTALYIYAEQGELPAGFDEETMQDAFRHRK